MCGVEIIFRVMNNLFFLPSNSSFCAYSILLDAFDFEYPVNTGNNMSVGFTPESGLDNFEGLIAAFFDYDDGLLGMLVYQIFKLDLQA